VSAAYRVAQARMLIVAFEELVELQVPVPPRRVSSQAVTFLNVVLTSFRVARH
jgi:hypothetical protein